MVQFKRHKRKLYCVGALCLGCVLLFLGRSYVLTKSNEAVASQVPHLELESMDALPPLQIGDVILRMGVGADSYAIASASHSQYSHVGMISALEPEILVTHASTVDDPPANFEGVSTITLKDFVYQGQRIAIVRYKDFSLQEQKSIQEYLFAQEGKAFVISNDSNAFYCTTLVLKALQDKVPLHLKPTFMSIPLLTGDYYMPQALLEEPLAKVIYYYPRS